MLTWNRPPLGNTDVIDDVATWLGLEFHEYVETLVKEKRAIFKRARKAKR